MNTPLSIILIAIFIIIFIIFLILLSSYKNLTKLHKQVDESFEIMDNNFKERWILIPNIISILKRYMKQDPILENIIKLRNNLYNKKSKEEKIEINKKLETLLPKLLENAKSYPEIKTNKNFLDLLNKLYDIEKNIKSSKKDYQNHIKVYNNKLESFPNSLVAKLFKFTEIS